MYSCSRSSNKILIVISGITQANEIRCYGSKAAISLAIFNITTQGIIISNMTAKEPVMPAPSYSVLAPVYCGLPLTPPSPVIVMPSEDLLTKDYDSDYHVGPFVERGFEE